MEINPNRRATATTMSPPTGALLARGRAEPVPDVPLLDLGNEMLVVDEEQW